MRRRPPWSAVDTRDISSPPLTSCDVWRNSRNTWDCPRTWRNGSCRLYISVWIINNRPKTAAHTRCYVRHLVFCTRSTRSTFGGKFGYCTRFAHRLMRWLSIGDRRYKTTLFKCPLTAGTLWQIVLAKTVSKQAHNIMTTRKLEHCAYLLADDFVVLLFHQFAGDWHGTEVTAEAPLVIGLAIETQLLKKASRHVLVIIERHELIPYTLRDHYNQ